MKAPLTRLLIGLQAEYGRYALKTVVDTVVLNSGEKTSRCFFQLYSQVTYATNPGHWRDDN